MTGRVVGNLLYWRHRRLPRWIHHRVTAARPAAGPDAGDLAGWWVAGPRRGPGGGTGIAARHRYGGFSGRLWPRLGLPVWAARAGIAPGAIGLARWRRRTRIWLIAPGARRALRSSGNLFPGRPRGAAASERGKSS